MKTQEGLKMTRFQSEQQRLVLTVLYTASNLMHQHRTLLKPHGITPEQFNILRILKGQRGTPIALKDVTERMIDQNSNTSRLLDKLKKKGWVQCIFCPADRRRIEITLTQEGHRTIDNLSLLMEGEMQRMKAFWTDETASKASQILDTWNQQLKTTTSQNPTT